MMFGWFRRAAARASRWNRSRSSGSAPERLAQNLDGDRPAEGQILGAVHHRHATLTQDAPQAIPTASMTRRASQLPGHRLPLRLRGLKSLLAVARAGEVFKFTRQLISATSDITISG